MTLPYKFNDLTGEAVKEEVIVTNFCSKNLNGKTIPIYGHQMVCLNPNHPEPDTPVDVRDWLDLFYQSIHSPQRPIINLNNAGIKRAVDLIDFDKFTPQELEKAKNEEQAAYVKSIYEAEAESKGKLKAKNEIALKSIAKGLDNTTIADITGLAEIEVEQLRK